MSIYDQLVAATTELLGPASERFIDRQISNHLKIEPRAITAHEVADLAHWIRLSISVLSNDHDTLRTYELAIQKISKKGDVWPAKQPNKSASDAS